MGGDEGRPATSPAARPRAGLAKAALVRGQALAGVIRGGPPRPGLRILYYHRVSDERDPLAVSPDAFRRQMDALAASGQRVVDLYEIDELALAPGEAAIAITFDDGYRDVLEHGLPVLREHGFPSTVFVVPGAISGDRAFAWYAAGRHAAAGRLGRAAGGRMPRGSCTSSRTRSRIPS